VFELFLGQLDFSALTLDEALRRMVLKFRMPGEAQQIDRIMEAFARYTTTITITAIMYTMLLAVLVLPLLMQLAVPL
jgi:Sec7 domain